MIEAPQKEILVTAAYLEEARTHLDNLAASLRRRADVTDVLVNFLPREYASGLVIESYVEAELADGRALLWWLELSAGQEYRIEASVALTDQEGQRTLETLAERCAASLPEALQAFAAAAESLAHRNDTVALLGNLAHAAA